MEFITTFFFAELVANFGPDLDIFSKDTCPTAMEVAMAGAMAMAVAMAVAMAMVVAMAMGHAIIPDTLLAVHMGSDP